MIPARFSRYIYTPRPLHIFPAIPPSRHLFIHRADFGRHWADTSATSAISTSPPLLPNKRQAPTDGTGHGTGEWKCGPQPTIGNQPATTKEFVANYAIELYTYLSLPLHCFRVVIPLRFGWGVAWRMERGHRHERGLAEEGVG